MVKWNVMAKRKTAAKAATAKRTADNQELDSVFLLKLVLYMIVGSQWVRFTDGAGVTLLPLPIGLLVGLIFATHDHFRIDRKIEFAVLLVAMLVGFWTQAGIYVRL